MYNKEILNLFLFVTLFACNSVTNNTTPSRALSDSEIKQEAQNIHENCLVLDAHADIALPTTSPLYLSKDGKSKNDLEKMIVGGTNAVIMSLAIPPGPRTTKGDAQGRLAMNEQLAFVKNKVKHHSDKLVIATNSSEITAAFQANKIAIILGFQNARALQKDINTIDSFYQEGVRVFGFNHIGHNDFSDSSRPFFDATTEKYEATSEHGGLSELGKVALRRINRLGAIVDVSQLSRPATLQAVQLSVAPVMASHSNVFAISNVSRNLSDEEIDLIAKKGGIVCVSPFRAYLLDYSDPAFLEKIKKVRRDAGISEKYSYPFELYWEIKDPTKKLAFLQAMSDTLGPAYVKDLVQHIDYIAKRVGIDHIGIGSDFNHGGGINGYEDAADAFNVTLALLKKGYSKRDIQKIWSGNFLRVLEEVEQIKESMSN